MTSRVGPRVRHSRGMRSFPRGVPRKFKRRDHPTLLSRQMYVRVLVVCNFFFFPPFFTHYPLLSRVVRDDVLELMPNDSPSLPRSSKRVSEEWESHSRSVEIISRGGFPSMRRVDSTLWLIWNRKRAVHHRSNSNLSREN